MKILVMGSTGFIGSNIAAEFERLGHEVSRLSFRDPSWTTKIGKLDAVFHEAAIKNTLSTNRREMFRVNVDLSKKLFKQVAERGCHHIIYASSTAVYGNVPPPQKESGPLDPLNPYAESKKMLDEFAMDFAAKNQGIVVIGLRYGSVYGPGENQKGKTANIIYQLAQQIINSNPKIFRYGEQKRDFVYIKDVVRANTLAFKAKESGIYNCASGKATTFNDVVQILCKILDKKRGTEYIKNPNASTYQNHIECDMNLAKDKLKFVPIFNIERGIIDYYKSGLLV